MKYYVVDAFSEKVFGGNQAGVCVMDSWPDDCVMQDIAAENNLAETAFAVKNGPFYDLRWFTPAVEIELCGHATLATAFVIFSFIEKDSESLEFHTMSGVLTVTKQGGLYRLDFPVRSQQKTDITEQMKKAAGVDIKGAYAGYNLTLELEDEEAVRTLDPDISELKKMKEYHGVIFTARGNSCDFVSRFFAPNMGVNEDPVTGSSHTSLIPFWAKRLNKEEMTAKQLSKRGGTLYCRNAGDRVFISGGACLYLSGEIHI